MWGMCVCVVTQQVGRVESTSTDVFGAVFRFGVCGGVRQLVTVTVTVMVLDN